MKKIGLLYGPYGGNTEKVARLLASEFGDQVDLLAVKDIRAEDLEEYKYFIFGGATIGKETWDSEVENDWYKLLPKLEKMNLKGKKAAVFGLGDHISYSAQFVDDIGELIERLSGTGIEFVGQVPVDGYTFDESKAVKDGMFLGLPLDEDHESHLTEERVKKWVLLLKKEFLNA